MKGSSHRRKHRIALNPERLGKIEPKPPRDLPTDFKPPLHSR